MTFGCPRGDSLPEALRLQGFQLNDTACPFIRVYAGRQGIKKRHIRDA